LHSNELTGRETPLSTPDPTDAVAALTAQHIDVVRLSYPDLIGVDRGRDILTHHLPSACAHGLSFCRAVYHTSPRGDTVDVAGGLDAGLPDICVRPDLDTLVPLPWEPGVAWCLGDPVDPATGLPCPESPRDLLRRVVADLAAEGLTAVVGPELEYFLLDRDDTAPTG
jgi:glutamine synthetase